MNHQELNLTITEKYFKEYKRYLNQTSFELLVELFKEEDYSNFEKFSLGIIAGYLKAPLELKDLIDFIPSSLKDNFDSITKYFGQIIQKNQVALLSIANFEDLKQNNLEQTIFIININDNQEFEFTSWAGVLRIYNLMQFSKNSLFVTNKGLENELYDEINLFPNISKNLSHEWETIYDDVIDNEVKKFIKDLSIINQMPIPNVGEELVNNEGITVAEAELLWEEYSIALVLEETDLNIDGIKIFTLTKLNELKNELLERIS